MDLITSIFVFITLALFYLPPIYLGWRFFWKRNLKGWAWGTWVASLWGPFAYIVFGIGYLTTRGIRKACPQCGADTHSGKKLSTTLQGELLKEPIFAWLALIGGGILAIGTLITVMGFLVDGEELGGFCSTFGIAAMFGISGVSWGYTQLNKVRANQASMITTYHFKCPACGHTWEHKVEPLELSELKLLEQQPIAPTRRPEKKQTKTVHPRADDDQPEKSALGKQIIALTRRLEKKKTKTVHPRVDNDQPEESALEEQIIAPTRRPEIKQTGTVHPRLDNDQPKESALEKRDTAPKKQPEKRITPITTCPKCNMKVIPKSDGTCPSCQSKIP
jgi:rubrerythrin